ncbi:MAG: hypothetical protein BRC44_05585 [Cyanobacteria bacterium QS_4_48_99]|nr:MAG: hypothetical protein BRC44_05585 [Cyanobacteria bacterium QS_4_48_99]
MIVHQIDYLLTFNTKDFQRFSEMTAISPKLSSRSLLHCLLASVSTRDSTITALPVSKNTGLTAHVERWNNTLRQRLARFVRRTLSFSKSELMHENALRLFFHRYNLNCLT